MTSPSDRRITMKKSLMDSEYKKIGTQSLSIEKLFLDQGMDIIGVTDCGDKYTCHDQNEDILSMAKEICGRYKFWVKKQSKIYVSMATSFYPKGSVRSCALMASLIVLIHYVESKLLGNLNGSSNQLLTNESTTEILDRLIMICEDNPPMGGLSDLERGLKWILNELNENCDIGCCIDIKEEIIGHLRGKYNNDDERKETCSYSSVSEYMERKKEASELWFMIVGAPYCLDAYLDWEYYKEINIDLYILKLQTFVVDFFNMTNDLFSFENDCIASDRRDNFICVIYDTRYSTLLEAIENAIKSMCHALKEYHRESCLLREKIKDDPELDSLRTYIEWTDNAVRSCWTWQYSGPGAKKYFNAKKSIFAKNPNLLKNDDQSPPSTPSTAKKRFGSLRKSDSIRRFGLSKNNSLKNVMGFAS